ncbi:MAG: protein translocase subunit SecD [Opitutaceae bacterium]
MLKRNLWKILLSLAILAWAVSELVPTKDTPFIDYAREHATAKQPEFAKLLDEAKALEASREAGSAFLGLKRLARDRQIDLAQYFPSIDLSDVKNLERRNSLLLDELLRRSKSKLQAGLDLRGGVSVILEVAEKPATAPASAGETKYVREQQLSKAVEVISNRVNQFGVAEPIIRPVGNNQIEVQIAIDTKTNPNVVPDIIKPAKLEFHLVHPQAQALPQAPSLQDIPPGFAAMPMDEENKKTGEAYTLFYLVKQIPEMSGEHIENARAVQDPIAGIQVTMNFDSEGAKQFGEVTTANVGRLLAIVLDGKLYSAPRINGPITGGSAQITGRFDAREAERLAGALNNPLATPLVVKALNEVGPSLAAGAIESGKLATYIGVGLVAGFMICYYTVAGFIAVVSVTLNILIVLATLASFGATITMPGIAGIVLTVGMAVDAHILIFERMREELNLGKSLPSAFHAGHDKAFTTIVDANLTTLITSGLMIAFGTGPVRGFGVTITIGIFSTMFTALVVSEFLLDLAISGGVMKKMVMMNIRAPKIDFLKYGRRAFIASWLVVLIGVIGMFVKGHNVYGIDFAGGDVVTLSFKQPLIESAQLQAAADSAKLGEVTPTYQTEISTGKQLLNLQTEVDHSDAAVAAMQKAFPQAGFEVLGKTTIGPSIGKEIQWNAILSIGLSLLGIMIYVAFRFEMGYGIGAVVSTIHDVLITVGIFVLTGRQFTAPMVGAILLIVGYSINDTIVVFDRIREELKLNPAMNLRDVINFATNRVFTRSILTSLTTFLAALALFIFGGGVINDLSFTFLVGIVTGTFSSIFIASPIFYWWHKGDRKHVEAHHDIAPKYEWQGSSKASE